MAGHTANIEAMPVVRDLADFDQKSGNALERLVFNNRLRRDRRVRARHRGARRSSATRLTLNASFEKMIPQGQPYIKNYLDNKNHCAASATRCASWSRTPRATSSTRATSKR